MKVLVQNTNEPTKGEWLAGEYTRAFTIGRDNACDVRLQSAYIANTHVSVFPNGDAWFARALPRVPPFRVLGKPTVVLQRGDELKLALPVRLELDCYLITLTSDVDTIITRTPDQVRKEQEEEFRRIRSDLHRDLLDQLDLPSGRIIEGEPDPHEVRAVNAKIDQLLRTPQYEQIVFKSELTRFLIVRAFRSPLRRYLSIGRTDAFAEVQRFGPNEQLDQQIHQRVLELARRMDIDRTVINAEEADRAIANRLEPAVMQILPQLDSALTNYLILRLFKDSLYDTLYRLGPLQELMDAPDISDVMVVNPKLIYVERRNGPVAPVDDTFVSDDAAMNVLERMVGRLGRRIDRTQPMVDVRLPKQKKTGTEAVGGKGVQGDRVNAVIPPVAVQGPCITIRRFPTKHLTLEDISSGPRASMSRRVALMLKAAVVARLNIVVAGGTGSGKTTLLNALGQKIPHRERVVTIEDAVELQLQREHTVTMETVLANAEGKGELKIRDLLRNALRMRPDRIMIGECRGPEAADMLQAMNTGHDGSMTTLHANSSQDVISRLETMVLQAGAMPLPAVRRQIASAVDLIIMTGRSAYHQDNRKQIMQITEVIGLSDEGEVELMDLETLAGYGEGTRLRPTGYTPSFLARLVGTGLIKPEEWFTWGDGEH